MNQARKLISDSFKQPCKINHFERKLRLKKHGYEIQVQFIRKNFCLSNSLNTLLFAAKTPKTAPASKLGLPFVGLGQRPLTSVLDSSKTLPVLETSEKLPQVTHTRRGSRMMKRRSISIPHGNHQTTSKQRKL